MEMLEQDHIQPVILIENSSFFVVAEAPHIDSLTDEIDWFN
jgi:hypothetical protein